MYNINPILWPCLPFALYSLFSSRKYDLFFSWMAGEDGNFLPKGEGRDGVPWRLFTSSRGKAEAWGTPPKAGEGEGKEREDHHKTGGSSIAEEWTGEGAPPESSCGGWEQADGEPDGGTEPEASWDWEGPGGSWGQDEALWAAGEGLKSGINLTFCLSFGWFIYCEVVFGYLFIMILLTDNVAFVYLTLENISSFSGFRVIG